MKKLLMFAAFVSAAAVSVSVSEAAPDFKMIITEAPIRIKAGKVKESVELLMGLEGLAGRSILEKKRLAGVLQDMHKELAKREELAWLYKLAEHARKLFPTELNSGANFGEACMAKGDFERAAKVLAEAAGQSNSYYVAADRDAARVNLLLARADLVLGDAEGAEEAIGRAIEISPSGARLHYARAQVMLQARKWDQVADALNTAFRLDAKLAQPVDYLVRASCVQREGDYDQAQKVLVEGLSRYPMASGLHCALGKVFLAKEESRDDAAKERPPKRFYAEAFYQFQYEIMLSGPLSSYTDEARDQIEIMTALIDREKDHDNYLKVAYGAAALMNMTPGSYEKAIENIKKGLRANGDDCLPLQVLLGHAYVGLGDDEKAAKAFETVLRIDPFFPPGYVDLGDIYEKLGKRENALEQYGKALALDKHNWRVREMLKRIDKLN